MWPASEGGCHLKKIVTLPVPGGRRLSESDTFLKSKHNLLATFDCVDDLVTAPVSKITRKDLHAIEHHMVRLRAALARTLWSNEFFIGRSILDEYILHMAKTGAGGVCQSVMAELDAAGADRPGFVLYPLTRFGLEMPRHGDANPHLKAVASFRTAGFAVCSQAQTLDTLHATVSGMARSLGIRQRIERGDLRHYSYAAKWLTRNPMLMVRVASQTGDMYENQFVYTLRIRLAVATILMLHALAADGGSDVEDHHSSSFVNNFETLDIGHYIIGESVRAQGPLQTRRVPMNISPVELARLSDLGVTISTSILASARMTRFRRQVEAALQFVGRGHFTHVTLRSSSAVERRLYSRLLTALDWYRFSFGSLANEAEAIVGLAVAFDTLLTDLYQKGVAERIKRRVGLCMRGAPDVASYRDSVHAVYVARNQVVHTGDITMATDIVRARAAFARCFCHVATRLAASVPTSESEPIRELLGDL
ncbi:HEPN domain-containing protein [Sphingosinicella sp. LY1275]|uniref:HEPN domain-containing protein n=1 Tax=Sphingosinicella sp. LY1275 TaxID=3095379 RepID=UPI002ADEB891|nr:HEPN domain-containing protein [Sphingosinicella sp. LY1275]MEA1015154.1 HEPN domain-containing protein [Sphingosinicella sp. LY1275]